MSNPHHIVQPKTYYGVFAILLVLLVATVLAAQIPNPLLNVVAAITIASAKAVLIVLYFMHVRYSTPLVRVIVVAGLAWLLLLIAFTLSDFATRGWDREAAQASWFRQAQPAKSRSAPSARWDPVEGVQ